MATVGETSRPGYVYDSATDVWIPVGIGPHSHTPAAIGAVSSSVVTAKGDLIVATSSGVVTNKSVGTDGTYLVADSTQTTGVNWAGPSTMAGRNAVLNSNFSVWQRGTTGAGSGTAFVADRWQAYRGAAGSTFSRQVTNDTTNLPFIQYCIRAQRDSGNTSTSPYSNGQNFESVNSIPLAGKTVVLSFYARAGANYSAASGALEVNLATGTGTDQNIYTGLTGRANPILQNATLTTTWQRFTYSATLATTATQVAMSFAATPVGTAGANDYFEVTGVQLEVGSVATPYAPNGATYQAELAACQRYYFRATADTSAFAHFSLGFASSTTSAQQDLKLPVTMRTEPTSVDFSTLRLEDINSAQTVTTCTLSSNASNTNTATFDVGVASGLTAYRPYFLGANNSTSAYVGVSAEL
jgi:hypothetical protein